MSQVYFAPASAKNPVNVPDLLIKNKLRSTSRYSKIPEEWTPYTNFKQTVINPVCSSEKLGIPPRYDLVPVWGLTPQAAQSYWKELRRGDLFIFYTGLDHAYIARLDEKEINSDLAENLWPLYDISTVRSGNAADEPWSRILYLDSVWYASFRENEVQSLRNSQDTVIRQFSQIPSNRLKRLEASPEQLIEEKTSGLCRVAILSQQPKRRIVSRAIRKGESDTEILKKVLEDTDHQPSDLTEDAKQAVLRCVKEIYPEVSF